MKVTQLITILGITMLVFPSINAQESKSPWTFGVKAGVNSSTFDTDDSFRKDGTIGYNVGATVEYKLKNNFFLSSGLEFTTKGADKYLYQSVLPPIENDQPILSTMYSKDSRRLKYLQAPLTIGYRVPVSSSVNITFNAGGYFGVSVSGKGTQSLYTTDYYVDGSSKSSFKEQQSNKKGDTDYGLLLGMGVEYKKFSLNANYEHGLRNLYTGRDTYYGSDSNSAWKNRNYTLSVGYKF